MVGVDDNGEGMGDNGEGVGVDMRKVEAEDELSELGLKEDHKGVLEVDLVLEPVDPEFAIDEELKLDNG